MYSRPNAAFGYYRGNPLGMGQGSNMGPKNQGAGILSQGQGMAGAGGWHPTILYLIVFIAAEMIVFGFISKALR